jgi:drug/metabolite transporter (DMT)-like permease
MLALLVGVILNDEKLSGGAFFGVVILLAGLLLYFSREIKASYNARLSSSTGTE